MTAISCNSSLHRLSGSEAFYADLVLLHASDGVIISSPDLKVIWVNHAFTQLTGHDLDTLAGSDLSALLHGRETDEHAAALIRQACHQRSEIRVDIMKYARDGRAFWVDMRVTPVFDAGGTHTHFIATMRDITERKELERQNEEMRNTQALRQSERQLLALTSEWLYSAKSLAELLMVVQRAVHTLIPEADGALYIFGEGRNSLELATSWGSIPDFAVQIRPDECWALRRGRAYAYGLKAIEFACDHVTKPETPYFCLPIIAHGETIGLLHLLFEGFEENGFMRHMREDVLRNRWDVSLICAEQISLAIANVRLRQELLAQSVTDPLTGLGNRRRFMEQAARIWSRADGAEHSLISFDVDHFKQFNDSFGHDAGDFVLHEVGALLTQHFTSPLLPCRLGGEEFSVLCPGLGHEAALAAAEMFREALAGRRLVHAGSALPELTVSAGVATFPAHGCGLDSLMSAADAALYAAKKQGRNRVMAACPQPEGKGVGAKLQGAG